jgi:CRISP-associated protein Cas1
MSTIYVTEKKTSFKIQHQYLKMFCYGKQRTIRIRNISQIIIFGAIKLPKDVMQIIRLNQIPVLYLRENCEFIGRVENPSPLQTKYLNYQRQRLHDVEFNHATAESITWAKLHNQYTFLQSWTPHHVDYTIQSALDYLKLLMDNLPAALSINDLREYMEEADKIYYCAVASIISFCNPCTQTTLQQINRLLKLGNQLLHQYIYTHLVSTGLHPEYGIIHSDTHHELPLAWDFSVEFRPAIVDDLVINFVRNLPNLNSNGNGNGQKCPLNLIQHFLKYWEGKLMTFVLHPYAGEVSYRQCIEIQVREYAASLLGDVEYYRPLALKLHPQSHAVTNVSEKQKPVLTLV